MQKLYDNLILIGSISIDRIMSFSGKYEDMIQPDKLHIFCVSPLIEQLKHTRGGVAANIAYSLSLLGNNPILLASIGKDGGDYLQDLTNMGIDTTHMHISDLPTSTYTVMTDANDCQVGGFYPGAMSDSASLTLAPWFGKNALVVVSPYDPPTMDRLVQEAKTHNLRLIYDIGQQVHNVTPDDLLAGIETAELLILNDYELAILAKRTKLSEEKIKSIVPIVVTTLGEQGSVIEGKSTPAPIHISAIKNLNVVDPTGSGDAYRAGFLHGYARGWDVTSCAQLGSTIATYTLLQLGTQTHHFTLEEVSKKYYSAYGKQLPK